MSRLTVALRILAIFMTGLLLHCCSRPSPVPVAAVKPDTVWLGCTWVETHDGKVIVKYERLVNPVLWDSIRLVKVKTRRTQ